MPSTPARKQSLSDFLGEHWLIEGVDNLPKDTSSGNHTQKPFIPTPCLEEIIG